MSDITKLTIAESLEALSKKEFSATELTKAYIKKMEDGRKYNAYVAETPEKALEQAKASDEKYVKGGARALEGVPLGIKDLFCTKGIHSQACSNVLRGFKPEYESTVTQNLLDAGASFLGKLNMDEMAMGSTNETSCYGPVINPWSKDVDLVPGGSSGGSVAAVAANMCAGATASDTGGSIRQPAAFCGVTGIKPTYGRCSRYGMMAYASSLDQAGPVGKDVKDCALLLNVMSGYDVKDSTSINQEVPDFTSFLKKDIKGLKIGIPKEYRLDGMNKEVEAAWDKGAQMLRDRGAEVVEISLPYTQYALPTYYIIASAEASSNLARYDGVRYGLRVNGEGLDDMYVNTRTEGFGEEVKRRIAIGAYVLSAGYYNAYYVKAQSIRRLIRNDFIKALEKVDAILAPIAPSTAFPIGDKSMREDAISMYLNDVFTVSLNLAGLPGMTVPVDLAANGLPLGLQIIGRPFDEATVFKFASALEADAKFKRL